MNMAIDPGHITEKNITPDAPFRSGITGKYKLLIKTVTRKAVNYEYELVDSEGKEYQAESEKHYTENNLLRCIVFFKVVNAALVVTETHICGKQDLTTALPEEKKAQPKPVAKPIVVDDSRPVDNPRQAGKSGLFYLRVVGCEKSGTKNVYWVMDATGSKYKVDTPTKKTHPLGKVVVCNVYVATVQGKGLTVRVPSITKKQTTAPKPKKKKKIQHVKRSRSSYSSRDWLGTPCVGDHFHIIYTPMGNKR